MRAILLFAFLFMWTNIVHAQSSLSISVPMIWSNVKVKDNWTPPTAPHYKKYRSGSTFGYGVSINYSFQPKLLIKNQSLFIDLGVGYYNQKFDVVRYFDYHSPLYLVFSTEYYSYSCMQGLIGLTLKRTMWKEYFLSGSMTFYSLQSFKQIYEPYRNRGGTDHPRQIGHQQINFSKIITLNIGLSKYLFQEDRFSLGIYLLAPVYTRWRNDRIFRDDPTTFSSPTFSIGTSISIAYHFNKKQQ